MKERLAALGFEPVGNTPEECAAQFRTEIAKWAKVIRDGGHQGGVTPEPMLGVRRRQLISNENISEASRMRHREFIETGLRPEPK